jgi:predicted MFS family arabinose efflux permease
MLPVLNVGLSSALAGLLLARFAFEFTLVSNMALLSEQSPTQRGKVLTFGVTSALLGSTLAGITGPWSYQMWGVAGLTVFSAPAILLALLVIVFLVREPS